MDEVFDIEDTLTEEEFEVLAEQRFHEQYCSGISSESLGLWDSDF